MLRQPDKIFIIIYPGSDPLILRDIAEKIGHSNWTSDLVVFNETPEFVSLLQQWNPKNKLSLGQHDPGDSSKDQGCGFPFYSMTILGSGEVVCCPKSSGKCVLGNIVNHKTLQEIWSNIRYQVLRKKLILKQRDFGDCNGCTYHNSRMMTKVFLFTLNVDISVQFTAKDKEILENL